MGPRDDHPGPERRLSRDRGHRADSGPGGPGRRDRNRQRAASLGPCTRSRRGPGRSSRSTCGAISQSLIEDAAVRAHQGSLHGSASETSRGSCGPPRAVRSSSTRSSTSIERRKLRSFVCFRELGRWSPSAPRSRSTSTFGFLSAAQDPLRRACDSGRFRPDLLARLDGFTYRLRPLRERVLEDIGVCAATILKQFALAKTLPHRARRGARPSCVRVAPQHPRARTGCLLRASALAEKGVIRAQHLPLRPVCGGLSMPTARCCSPRHSLDGRRSKTSLDRGRLPNPNTRRRPSGTARWEYYASSQPARWERQHPGAAVAAAFRHRRRGLPQAHVKCRPARATLLVQRVLLRASTSTASA